MTYQLISLLSIIYDAKTTTCKLNKDLQKIAEWAHQWKMSFNTDLNIQAQEVIFSMKMTKSSHLKSLSTMYLFLVQVFKSI